MVGIDHEASVISIHALFYSKNNTKKEQTQIAKGLDFWNLNSDKYHYILPSGHSYSIRFDLRHPEGEYSENGFFLPALSENHAVLNQVEIVSDSLLNAGNEDPTRIVAGYSPNNFVYIGESYYDQESVWIHEIGHRIGATHRHGRCIMSHSLSSGKQALAPATVRELLEHAGISFPGLQLWKPAHHSGIRPAKIVHQGEMPADFFTSGKLKKRRLKRSFFTKRKSQSRDFNKDPRLAAS